MEAHAEGPLTIFVFVFFSFCVLFFYFLVRIWDKMQFGMAMKRKILIKVQKLDNFKNLSIDGSDPLQKSNLIIVTVFSAKFINY